MFIDLSRYEYFILSFSRLLDYSVIFCRGIKQVGDTTHFVRLDDRTDVYVSASCII